MLTILEDLMQGLALSDEESIGLMAAAMFSNSLLIFGLPMHHENTFV